MDRSLFFYAFGVWFIFLIVALINAGFRESFLKPKVDEHLAHVISTIMLSSIFLVVTYLFINNREIDYTDTDLLLVGVFWVTMTIIFEFGFGHYVMGNSWEKLLADYNIFKGRIWIVVLITEFIAPLLFGSILK